VADEFCVGGWEFEITELIATNPAEVLNMDWFGFAGKQLAVEEAEADGFFRIGVSEVFDKFADANFDPEFFANFADEAGFERFAGFDFAAWKFPEIGQVIVGTALRDEEFAFVKNQRGGDVDRFQFTGQSICR
jgi:hypothetical protein